MINISTNELVDILTHTPAEQNIMLVGRHGIGKSQILTEFFEKKGLPVVALFLGQMSDPGDLIGLPTRNEETGKTDFMPPYWFPIDGKPIVLFLDELNRARPEVLQTIMDLALNRKLAGRSLPVGSRVISAVNDGEEYQLTDLDPALVSRFNVYRFLPTPQEWLLWATTNKIDKRVCDFIQHSPDWLDSVVGQPRQIYTGLEKTPDRRAWHKVSDVIHGVTDINRVYRKIIAGIVGASATAKFIEFITNERSLTGKDILLNFESSKAELEKLEVHQLSLINESVYQYIEAEKITSAAIKSTVANGLSNYVDWLDVSNKEALLHFVSIFSQGTYKQAAAFIMMNNQSVYSKMLETVKNL